MCDRLRAAPLLTQIVIGEAGVCRRIGRYSCRRVARGGWCSSCKNSLRAKGCLADERMYYRTRLRIRYESSFVLCLAGELAYPPRGARHQLDPPPRGGQMLAG